MSPVVSGLDGTGTTTHMTTLPPPTAPGNTKAALSLPVLPLAIIIAGVLSIANRRR
ncbi:MAG: hypothetical protein WCP36_03085 [Methanomicrobiales archaeon]